MNGNEVYNNGNSSTTGIWVILGLLILAVLIYYFAKIFSQRSREHRAQFYEADDTTLSIIADHLKSFYTQVRNRFTNSYKLMYSIPLVIDETLSGVEIVTDLRDLGIAYGPAKSIGYPYLAKLVSSSDNLDWNRNLSMVHDILEKLAEIDVIKLILENYSDKLVTKDLNELNSKVEYLTKECESFTRIKAALNR